MIGESYAYDFFFFFIKKKNFLYYKEKFSLPSMECEKGCEL